MVDVTFYQHKKTLNSTKKPSGDGVTFACEFKEPSTIDNPVVRLSIGVNPPQDNNYAYINVFGRYYFVDRWTWDGGLWSATLSVDPMASFRGEIGDSTQFVLRSSAQNDDNIMDTLFPTAAGYVQTAVTYPSQGTAPGYEPFIRFMREYSQGIYVIGVLNSDALAQIGGSLAYYVFTDIGFKGFLEKLFSDVTWLDIEVSEISESLTKVLAKPFDYIKSCMWFPLNYDQLNTSDWPFISRLDFGFWELKPVVGRRLGAGTYNMVADLEVPKHPQAESEFSYYNLSPFTKYTLSIPPFGDIVLDTLQLYAPKNLQLRFHIDFVSGMGKMLIVKPGSPDVILQSVRAMIAVPVEIGTVVRDLVGQAGGLFSAATAALNLDFGGFAEGITSTSAAVYGRGETKGAAGSIVEYRDSPYLLAEFLEQTDIDIAHSGRPLYQNKKISSVKGYVKCLNPKIEIDGSPSEISAIEGYMAGGFYYE